jgi:hypothetical protein
MTVTPLYSMDGGASWTETILPLPQGWGGMTDPDIVYTPDGTAVLSTEGLAYALKDGVEVITTLAMVVLRSTDGGKSWSAPITIHANDPSDDKGWIACDTWPASSYKGRLYFTWGASSPIRFARSTDGGKTWKGVGAAAAGTELNVQGYAPAVCVGPDGVIHIAWHVPGSSTIQYIRSSDGGDSFQQEKTIATGVASMNSNLPITDGWPHFPGATFRVLTLCTIAATSDNKVTVAWADMREGVSRIYQTWSTDSGNSWQGGVSGQPLLNSYPVDNQHHFHPQLATSDPATVGCTFYEFGPKPQTMLIDIRLTTKVPSDTAFAFPGTITDQAWDPAIAAPFSHGDQSVTFIGEYFGLAGTNGEFFPVWTDTRTGLQELFCSGVSQAVRIVPPIPPEIWGEIVYGVVNDGGGLVIVGGVPIHIGPWGPMSDILNAIAALRAASRIGAAQGETARRALWGVIASIARAGERGSLGGGVFGGGLGGFGSGMAG